jgi:murein DD-endopeptidase MepM/ murein hydrolase activator NlpD
MIDTHVRPDTKTRLFIILFFLGCFVFSLGSQKVRAEQEFFSPFDETDRKSFEAIQNRLVGSYGEYRKSYKPGHLHAGVDLQGAFKETVYAIADGRVNRIYHEFPHRSVVVEHALPDGKNLYSIYTHVQEIKVNVGDRVDGRTPLARLFDEAELKRADFGTPNHLHFEIRISMADDGRASYASMTREELDKYCTDPMEFFRAYLEK